MTEKTAPFDVWPLIGGLLADRIAESAGRAGAYVIARLAVIRHEGATEGPIYEAKLDALRRAALSWDAEAFRASPKVEEPA